MTISIILRRSAAGAENANIFLGHDSLSSGKKDQRYCHNVVVGILYQYQVRLCEYFFLLPLLFYSLSWLSERVPHR